MRIATSDQASAVPRPSPPSPRTILSDYLVSNMVEEFSRIEGVGKVQVFGSQYRDADLGSTRPKLAAYDWPPGDVVPAPRRADTRRSSGGPVSR
ncbi:hypothetical protein CNY89_16380, partial [Amaricoccus sp. HAR-UPW-R2A-40]